jgi:hypothetical protein
LSGEHGGELISLPPANHWPLRERKGVRTANAVPVIAAWQSEP